MAVPTLPLANLSVANTMPDLISRVNDIVSLLNTSVGNAAFALLANNSTFAFGKTEGALNVNSALTALLANNSTFAFGKTEGNLNANSALFANNSTFAFGKTESNLNVNNATRLATPRAINGVNFDGTAAITITASTPNSLTPSSYIVGSVFNGSAPQTWSVDATTTASPFKVVARDSGGIANAVGFQATTGNYVNNTAATGIYNSANDRRLYNLDASYWGLQTGTTSGGLKFFSDAMSTLKGYVYWDSSGFGLLNASGAWRARIDSSDFWHISNHQLMDSGCYLFPGSTSGLSNPQTSYYLAAHATYGLYMNTGLAVQAYTYYWQAGDGTTPSTSTHVGVDTGDRIALSSAGTVAAWDGSQFYPFNSGVKNLGHPSFFWNTVFTNNVGIGLTPSFQLQVSADSAAKPTTSTWTVTSDAATKDQVADYTEGLDALRKIRPISYVHNGVAGTPKGAKGVGVIAQEIQKVLPNTVKSHREIKNALPNAPHQSVKDNTENDDILTFNAHELFFVMINAIKEIDARLASLEKH